MFVKCATEEVQYYLLRLQCELSSPSRLTESLTYFDDVKLESYLVSGEADMFFDELKMSKGAQDWFDLGSVLPMGKSSPLPESCFLRAVAGSLTGRTFYLTGSLRSKTRSDLHRYITALGGTTTDSFSSQP
jgi:NAD-dependent DNA ligase